MDIGEFIFFLRKNINTDKKEALDEKLLRLFVTSGLVDEDGKSPGPGVGGRETEVDKTITIEFPEAGEPFTYNVGINTYILFQRRYGITFVNAYDELSVNDDGIMTMYLARPVESRILTIGENRVRTIIFTAEQFPLRITPEQTGQHQWVMIPQVYERIEDSYVVRNDVIVTDADGGVTIDAVRPFNGRILIVEGA